MTLTQYQLIECVNRIFSSYDLDENNYLDEMESTKFIIDALKELKINYKISKCEIKETIKSIDLNRDGKISKDQLFWLFKKIYLKKN